MGKKKSKKAPVGRELAIEVLDAMGAHPEAFGEDMRKGAAVALSVVSCADLGSGAEAADLVAMAAEFVSRQAAVERAIREAAPRIEEAIAKAFGDNGIDGDVHVAGVI